MAIGKVEGAMAKTQMIFAFLAELGLLAAGCGGSSPASAKKSAGTPTTTSKKEEDPHPNRDDLTTASHCRGCRCPGFQAVNTTKSSSWRRSRPPLALKPNSTLSVAETYEWTLTLGEWNRVNEEVS
jgi:hypothetical protein